MISRNENAADLKTFTYETTVWKNISLKVWKFEVLTLNNLKILISYLRCDVNHLRENEIAINEAGNNNHLA